MFLGSFPLCDHGGGDFFITPKRNFMFFDMWVEHENYKEIVEYAWATPFYGTAQFQFCKRLKVLKAPLRTLNRTHYSHISSRAEEAKGKLEEAQQLLHDNPLNGALQQKVRDLKKLAWRKDFGSRKNVCLSKGQVQVLHQ